MATQVTPDAATLRREVQQKYTEVAANPNRTVGCQRNWTLLRPRKPKRLGVVEAPSEG